MFNLTRREQQVFALIVTGKSTKQAASELGIAFRTAVCHRYRIFEKLGVHSTAELILTAVRLGLVEADNSPTLNPDPETVAEWRQHLNNARQRLQSASEVSRQALEQSRQLPSADGNYAHQKALRAESLALAEYRRVLRVYTDLVQAGGKIPHEQAAS